jgi:hypothetical protein
LSLAGAVSVTGLALDWFVNPWWFVLTAAA